MKNNFNAKVFIFILIFMVAALVARCKNSTAYKGSDNSYIDNSYDENESYNDYDKKLYLTQEQEDGIILAINEGFLKINADSNSAYISLLLWNQMDYSLKEDFSAALAVYCGNKKGTHLYWCDIYDINSGKKIAKFSQSWGFNIY